MIPQGTCIIKLVISHAISEVKREAKQAFGVVSFALILSSPLARRFLGK